MLGFYNTLRHHFQHLVRAGYNDICSLLVGMFAGDVSTAVVWCTDEAGAQLRSRLLLPQATGFFEVGNTRLQKVFQLDLWQTG